MAEFAIVKRLIELDKNENRGSLARLRRGISSLRHTPDLLSFTDVLSFIPDDDNHPKRDIPYLLTASLFALHPHHTDEPINLGRALKSIANNDSADKRFRLIINANRDELPVLLRQAISLVSQGGVSINYHTLLSDLKHWEHPNEFVQQQWARSFWS